ncbi:MAG: hypothetical protein ABSF55_01540 [Candidatus Staskawiczbacteria bacterium]|jgi:hypothetical protein
MKASQLREFSEPGLLAGAYLTGSKNLLEVDERGYLAIPAGVRPLGFHLLVACLDDGRTLLRQKDVSNMGGDYASECLTAVTADLPSGFKGVTMNSPIVVAYEGQNVRTKWHPGEGGTNRLDSFHLSKDGKFFGLFQTGIFTHDNGESWRLFGEWRWRGRLYRSSHSLAHSGLVAIPETLRLGSFNAGTSNRVQIFDDPGFPDLLKGVDLESWNGADEEVEPVLPKPKNPDNAACSWWITFSHRSGGGIFLFKGKPAWGLTQDVVGEAPREDGEVQFHFGDEVAFEELNFNWGSKKGPPKLERFQLVNRLY